MSTPQQDPGQQPAVGGTNVQPGQLPPPGSLPKMPDSVVNYENKSADPSDLVYSSAGPQ